MDAFDDSGFFDLTAGGYGAEAGGYTPGEGEGPEMAEREAREMLEDTLRGMLGGELETPGLIEGGSAEALTWASLADSPAPASPAHSAASVSLAHSLDDAGVVALSHYFAPTSQYTPHPRVLAAQPAPPVDPTALYAPLHTSRFRTAAAAKAHRRRARLPPKSSAGDVARVKALGRDYWVCRIYNAMINSAGITDGEKSIHRSRFTLRAAFDAVDLEAAAHAVFDEAVAVHERGWNLPLVYYKAAVRGKLVDVSGASLEMRLSRICVVLGMTKSAVDDAVRGGVTLALLCDNPEARRFTKESNNAGNKKRGERLKVTATRERSRSLAEGEVDGGGCVEE